MILIINPGSSSIKYKLFDASNNVVKEDEVIFKDNNEELGQVVDKILDQLKDDFSDIEKIAVRIVHGGPKFADLEQVNEDVLSEIKKYSVLAPLHNLLALTVIEALLQKFDQNKVFALFDSGFFKSLPEEAQVYPLGQIESSLAIKRYGFHGISHKYMLEKTDPDNNKKIITIHLGAGCSISAIKNGRPIATSMGMTPDEGLIMQTRSGNLDPGLVLYLVGEIGLEKTKDLIEKKSGLAGLTNTEGSMLDVLTLAEEKIDVADYICKYEKTEENKKKADLALKIYIDSIKQYIGGYAGLMGGVDIIVFSGKIGAGSQVIRDKVLSGLNFLGNIEVKVVEPDEELAMAREVSKL